MSQNQSLFIVSVYLENILYFNFDKFCNFKCHISFFFSFFLFMYLLLLKCISFVFVVLNDKFIYCIYMFLKVNINFSFMFTREQNYICTLLSLYLYEL